MKYMWFMRTVLLMEKDSMSMHSKINNKIIEYQSLVYQISFGINITQKKNTDFNKFHS